MEGGNERLAARSGDRLRAALVLYTTARILTISESTLFYLPRDWTWSLALSEARSEFSGTGAEWRPAGMTRLGFPIAGRDEHRLGGNIFLARGTENFAQVDQIGSFSAQTYGGRIARSTDRTPGLDGLRSLSEAHAGPDADKFRTYYGIRF